MNKLLLLVNGLFILFRCPSRFVQGRKGRRSLVLLQLGAPADEEPRGRLAGREKHMPSSLHGRRVDGDPAGERVHQAETRPRYNFIEFIKRIVKKYPNNELAKKRRKNIKRWMTL